MGSWRVWQWFRRLFRTEIKYIQPFEGERVVGKLIQSQARHLRFQIQPVILDLGQHRASAKITRQRRD